jgi:hypothetical protein
MKSLRISSVANNPEQKTNKPLKKQEKQEKQENKKSWEG